MPIYHSIGNIPRKRHTQFRKPSGELYHEQLFGTEGFSGVSSLLYHHHAPTAIKGIGEVSVSRNDTWLPNEPVRPRKFMGFQHKPGGDLMDSRVTLMANKDLALGVAAPTEGMQQFYKNAEADEILFIHEGNGVIDTLMGELAYKPGDYIVIPRGIIYQFIPSDDNQRVLLIESQSPIRWPKRYQNGMGQLLEHAPFCERDIRRPQELNPKDEKGDFIVKVKKGGKLHEIIYGFHPFDVVGWDGFYYPYALSIHDFEPITGRIHQPPPVHQTFAGHNFVVCSFVPRLYDYHPDAIPAPYNHSNIDSDEILYYVDGDFMSRANVEKGMFTLHPGGLPHGPHPGTVEKSIGQKATAELAVMVDPFRPMYVTEAAQALEDPTYYKSWYKE